MLNMHMNMNDQELLYNFLLDFEIVHMDEFIDELLREERSCDVILPRIQVIFNWHSLQQSW